MSISYGGDYISDTDGGKLKPSSSVMRNRIINGAMVIDQRNAGGSVTPTAGNTYTVDRWSAQLSVASKYSVQQNAGSITPPVGFTNYLGAASTSAYSVGATDYFFLQQGIEGYNVADLQWGTANAKTVTVSFWVRSSLTGTFGGNLQSGNGRYYPFSYTISSANTWEQKSFTVAGDTTGTWGSTNGNGIYIGFGLGVGSTYSGTAGTWSSSTYLSATGATSVVGTNGATFYITGVQLEVGSSGTGFEYRQYGTELALCQRYFEQINTTAVTGLPQFVPIGTYIPKRTTPTITKVSGGSTASIGYGAYGANNSGTIRQDGAPSSSADMVVSISAEL